MSMSASRYSATVLGVVSALALVGCTPRPKLPYNDVAEFPAPTGDTTVRNYLIGPLDTIAVTVFQEPDLTVRDVPVDASGNVILPLIGAVHAGGKTSEQLSNDISARLARGILVNPQVSVIVQQSVSQKVTVGGSVAEPGVYQIQGRTTLLDALAMAKGTTRVAALNEVVIFRDINGRRAGALFNVAAINRGEQPDPEILGNDTVVVGLSTLKAAWRDVLTAAPLVATFRYF